VNWLAGGMVGRMCAIAVLTLLVVGCGSNSSGGGGGTVL